MEKVRGHAHIYMCIYICTYMYNVYEFHYGNVKPLKKEHTDTGVGHRIEH